MIIIDVFVGVQYIVPLEGRRSLKKKLTRKGVPDETITEILTVELVGRTCITPYEK